MSYFISLCSVICPIFKRCVVKLLAVNHCNNYLFISLHLYDNRGFSQSSDILEINVFQLAVK